jgi:hypothetical protein
MSRNAEVFLIAYKQFQLDLVPAGLVGLNLKAHAPII